MRRALVRRLDSRAGAIVDSLTEVVVTRVQSLGGDEVEHEWVRSSAQTNIELLLQVMAHPADLARVEPPLGGVALVRRIAQHGVPFYEIVRGYELAEWHWMQHCLRELASLTGGVDELVTETLEVGELVRDYIDLVCRGLSAEYEAERERWSRQEESARVGLVTALLRGATIDVTEAEAVLGYRLGQAHLAAIVWCSGPGHPGAAGSAADSTGGPGDELLGMRRATAELAKLAGGRGRPLVVARDHTTSWVWLPVEGRTRLDAAAVTEQHPRVHVALGDPAHGLDGFVASHRQASAAHEVGLAAGPGAGPVFPYREVSSLAFLAADLPRARAWVAGTLAGLAAPGPRVEELRRTLRIYVDANCSATTTARLMSCHKNTIQYRIRSAERLLGRGVDDAGVDLGLALLACRWLGETVLPRIS